MLVLRQTAPHANDHDACLVITILVPTGLVKYTLFSVAEPRFITTKTHAKQLLGKGSPSIHLTPCTVCQKCTPENYTYIQYIHDFIDGIRGRGFLF